ncbi:hypothetical protein CIK84_15685 [Glutamicibacter arilaitensis]|uniref:Uncharacterized protein n=1 Tax=Glutamicibacter arilaitensis TaxID=256701 RepID=A0A2N7RY56_9MICC|nr:hypothetical protein CIK84_15685 [Glutamicibacter arilaitensis]
MNAASNIAQAVTAHVKAEHHLEQTQATEKQAFTDALEKSWTQTELNKIGSRTRRRTRKSPKKRIQKPIVNRAHNNAPPLASR